MAVSRIIAAAALLCGLSGTALAEVAPPRTVAELDRRLAAAFAAGHIPGATVAIVQNGVVTFAKGYGYADTAKKIPATADTPFRAGSISKSITSIAVMTLVEQHRMSLDAPLAQLAPEVHFVNPWEKTDPIRLVDLLEHTTGWPDISTRVLAKDEKSWSTLQGVQFTSPEFVSRWKPGYFTVYNNAGPAVAGAVIEKVSGKTFDAYARDAVLRPMGMATADFDLTSDLASRIAKSYTADGNATPYQYIVLKPAGSLNISARELAQLVRFFIGRGSVDGRQILTPQSVARIERSEADLGARAGFHNAYGLGNAVFPDSGPTFRGHNGSIDSFTAVMGYNAPCRCGYVLMANGGGGVDFATPVSHMVQAFLTRSLPLDPPPTVKMKQSELENYTGFYWSITPPNALLRPYTDILNIGRVTAGDGKLAVSGLGGLAGAADMVPVSAHSFRRLDREDASLAFVEDSGRIYKIGAFNAQVKVSAWVVLAVGATLGLIALGALIGIVMLIPWIVGQVRGRLADRGGLTMRVMPLLSIAAMAVTFALPIMAYADSGATAVHRLAGIGWYSLTVMIASILFPLFAVTGLAMSLRNAAAPVFIRAYVGLASLGLSAPALYAASIGWFAVRTWTM
jgi:CubicO group peptidase (beta-lactamase class C family)